MTKMSFAFLWTKRGGGFGKVKLQKIGCNNTIRLF